MATCSTCKKDFSDDNAIDCFDCKETKHVKCIDKTSEATGVQMMKFVKKNKGFRWYCEKCEKKDNDVANELSEIKKMMTQVLKRLDLIEMNEKQEISTYASVAKDSKTSIIVKPKNDKENSRFTEVKLNGIIDPNVMNVRGIIRREKEVRIFTTKENEPEITSKLKEELKSDYDVKVVPAKKPRIKILNASTLDKKYTHDELSELIRNQNRSIFENADEIKIVKIIAKKDQIGMEKTIIIADVNGKLLRKIMKEKILMMNWKSCRVVEDLSITRCFQCSGYSHISKDCRRRPTCPKCNGEHQLTECQSSELKCANCVFENLRLSLNLDIKHAAWDRCCKTMQKKMENKKKIIDYT
jgi:hypothetical protein